MTKTVFDVNQSAISDKLEGQVSCFFFFVFVFFSSLDVYDLGILLVGVPESITLHLDGDDGWLYDWVRPTVY